MIPGVLRILGPGPIRLILRALLVSIACCAVSPADILAAKLQQETVQAWDRYFAWAEAKVNRELSDPSRFLIEDFLNPANKTSVARRLEAGEIVVQRMERSSVIPPNTHFAVPDGEIHHWWGAALIPGVTIARLLPLLQDYDHHAGRFADVEKSRLISKEGDTYRFFFRLRRTKVITVYYNTEQVCVYFPQVGDKASSRSVATRIAEIENPGKPSERERPAGDDSGYLWRLVSWWRFKQTARGVIVECESATLSRDIPTIVKLIPYAAAYIRSTPSESLKSILSDIRAYATSK